MGCSHRKLSETGLRIVGVFLKVKLCGCARRSADVGTSIPAAIRIKLAHIYINGGGVETRCEGSDIYETRIILAVYIQGPAAGFSTSPC